MRFNGVVLVAAVAALSACGGGDKGSAGASASATEGQTPAAAAAGATGTAAVTGTIHDVKMIGDEKGYRFEPADITIKAGDGVRWTMISGGPHNVAFQNVAADVKAQLAANMPNQISDLSGPMMITANEQYSISFASVKPGKYDYVCTPHIANGMKGSITVQ